MVFICINWSRGKMYLLCAPFFFICYLSVFISMDYLQYWIKQMIFVCLRRLDIFDFSTIVDNENASKENSVSSRKCSYWPCQLIVVLNMVMVIVLKVMVFNATFNNISAISWLSVLLVEETGVHGKNHRPVASYRQSVSLIASITPRH